jgi:hypothetical protein
MLDPVLAQAPADREPGVARADDDGLHVAAERVRGRVPRRRRRGAEALDSNGARRRPAEESRRALLDLLKLLDRGGAADSALLTDPLAGARQALSAATEQLVDRVAAALDQDRSDHGRRRVARLLHAVGPGEGELDGGHQPCGSGSAIV